MDDLSLIAKLEDGVREAEELLRRRKEALAALKGKGAPGKVRGRKKGFRGNSIPALAFDALKTGELTLDDLVAQMKKTDDSLTSRKVSLALNRYVRLGQHFRISEEGKYGLK
jgi:hypothetical protein